MDFTFPSDTLMLRDMLRRFLLKEARPLEMKYFQTGELDRQEQARLRQAVQQLGLWGLMVPEEFGGGGLDTVTACVIEEELGTTFVPVEMGEISPVLYACQGEQVTRFLEPAVCHADDDRLSASADTYLLSHGRRHRNQRDQRRKLRHEQLAHHACENFHIAPSSGCDAA